MQIATCPNCIHYDFERKCAAFPEGIPADIWEGRNGHTEKHKDQKNDLVFTHFSTLENGKEKNNQD